MKFCSNCGAQLPEGSKFCTECGQKVEMSPAPTQPEVPVYEAARPAEPAAPVYEAAQPAEPETPVYEPAPPVQEPVQPVRQPQPSFADPVYEMPKQAYQPAPRTEPTPGFTFGESKDPGAKPKSKKWLVIGGIATVLVLIIVLLVSCLGGGNTPDVDPTTVPATTVPPTTVPAVAEEVGYWTLLRIESEDPSQVAAEEDIAMLRSLGLELYVELKEDGTGILFLEELGTVTWADGKLMVEGETISYVIENDQLKLSEDGMTMVFARGEKSAAAPALPSATEPASSPVSTSTYSWWDGDWYGWWVVYSAYGEWEELEDSYWDAYAHIDVYEDDTGYIEIWDTDCAAGETIAWANVSFGSGLSQEGAMMSESGYFYDCELQHADWIADPDASEARFFENMICIDGSYEDPENPDNTMDYYIFLRPWGMDWEDVRVADTSECLYDEMMPLYYDDWYLPLIRSGAAMPACYEEGRSMVSSAAAEGAVNVGDYGVQILSAEKFVDYEGKPAVRVYYDFTNNSGETISASSGVTVELTQDGYELTTTYADYADDVPEYGNEYHEIRPGTTIRCIAEYHFKEDGGDILVSIEDYMEEVLICEASFAPGQLPGRPANDLKIKPVTDPQWLAGWPSEGVYDDYYIRIDSAERLKNENLVRVYFEYTNNSQEACSLWFASSITVYQDGISLDYESANTETETDKAYYMDIAPGETVMTSVCYALRSDSPIEVEISDFWSGAGIGAVLDIG